MYNILVMNGPNLNMLGVREPDVYGTLSLDQINARILDAAQNLPVTIEFFQSNHEGALIDEIQQAFYDGTRGIIINPGAYTHYSYAIRDAIASVPVPCVEVHLSDISSREDFRKNSLTEPVCVKQFAGMGWQGYTEALKFLVEYLDKTPQGEE